MTEFLAIQRIEISDIDQSQVKIKSGKSDLIL